jgi:hypothetical protein
LSPMLRLGPTKAFRGVSPHSSREVGTLAIVQS